jgi:hypothetical protein
MERFLGKTNIYGHPRFSSLVLKAETVHATQQSMPAIFITVLTPFV